MKTLTFAAVAALLAGATSVLAHDFKAGDLVIDHPMAFETAKTAKSGGGYLTITNTGTSDDRLIAVRADFPKVMLHTTEEKDGVARMMHVDGIDVPAGGTVALKPGGLHVMFMGLNGDPFEVGEEVPATLVFEKAGEVEVIFSIEERTSGHKKKDDHSGHAVSN
ncbi:copper chaperone PCu(A)C [Roseobacter sp. YSTF-M11]|uniref:Copper chaperone PCu(A)C n=1 Tax=Roseobacter insulae TaxID=2859783 RepID=A0A9X1FZ97_9RHOB|nr:copper chaperone PCu(A)C [Roseobacter insulae]MBW4710469.1 copper chaperone PCu(A)C [Roseobacter insulae]